MRKQNIPASSEQAKREQTLIPVVLVFYFWGAFPHGKGFFKWLHRQPEVLHFTLWAQDPISSFCPISRILWERRESSTGCGLGPS